jgi:hypothetical protein
VSALLDGAQSHATPLIPSSDQGEIDSFIRSHGRAMDVQDGGSSQRRADTMLQK